MVTHALVLSPLDYCNVLYMVLPLENIQELQVVQNAVACVVLCKSRFAYLSPLLLELH